MMLNYCKFQRSTAWRIYWTILAWVGLLIFSSQVSCQLAPGDSLVEEILFAQLEEESAVCQNGEGIFAPFEGATLYFDRRFGDMKELILEQTASLKQLNVSARVPAPSIQVGNAVYAIRTADTNQTITEIVFLLGESDDLRFCFKDGTFSTCVDEYTNIYQNTKDSTWVYKRGCGGWYATFRVPDVRLLTGSGSGFVKVVPSVTFSLKGIDIDQCPGSEDREFANTALCPTEQSECKHISGAGFKVGAYQCICTDCPECNPVEGLSLYNVDGDEERNLTAYFHSYCTPSDNKGDKGELLTITSLDEREIYVLLGIQALCVLMCLVFALVVIINKSSKVIQSSKLLVLELILFGAILKYVTILFLFLTPSVMTCILQPWLTEIGFICMFGALVLKTYKSLAEFQTRKARRVHIRDKDLLKYWFVCLLMVIIYLAAYTSITLNLVSTQNASLVSAADIFSDAKCMPFWWSYVTQITEILFIAFGFHMSIRLRTASSLFWETRWYALALLIELVTSLVYYILSAVWMVNSYNLFIMYFIYLQLSVTVTLLVVFIPKFIYITKTPATDGAFWSGTGNRTDLVDFRTHGRTDPKANGEIDIDEINIAEMSPDEIKKELRRVYEQLQTLKVKVMRYENPHLQGKRGHSKSKLPFYKQISKHGARKAGRGSTADVTEDAELEPLHSPQTSTPASDKNSSSQPKELSF